MRNQRITLILQARMGSTRLPGKSLKDLAGAPLVGRILERVKRCNMLDEIVLAIPDSLENEPLQTVGKSYNTKVFLGSENDLIDRYYQAALDSRADIVVRIPADNAVPQPEEVDRIIKHHLSLNRPGFSSNLCAIGDSGYPDGIGAEVFDFCLLSDIKKTIKDEIKSEHIFLNFYDYKKGKPVDSDWCPISTVAAPSDIRRPDLKLDVDTHEDYIFMKEIYETLYPTNPEFSIVDIIHWYDTKYNGPMKK